VIYLDTIKVLKMSRFYNGDYIKFIGVETKKSFFDKLFKRRKEDKHYICSYINQGEINF